MGWRYVYFTAGGVIFLMSILRVAVIRFHETPKFALCRNDDAHVVATLGTIAAKYNRPFTLTVQQLQACGQVNTAHSSSNASASASASPSTRSRAASLAAELALHYRNLFLTRTAGLSVALVWLSWALIGLAYPLFYIFLPEYLASRGADFGQPGPYTTWRNYAITNSCGIAGPVIAGGLCRTRALGRKGTMVVGGLVSSVFFSPASQFWCNETCTDIWAQWPSSSGTRRCAAPTRTWESRAPSASPSTWYVLSVPPIAPRRRFHHLPNLFILTPSNTVLRHALRVHARSDPVGAPRDRQRHGRRAQPRHGHRVRHCRHVR